jgi:CBS domain-containing protein
MQETRAMRKVSDVMTGSVRLTRPDETIREAAMAMAQQDIGSLPVGDDDRLVGIVTDRDIAVRAVARGLGPDTPVREVMSADIKYCYEDEDIESVAQNMADLGVRRLPVVNRDKRLVGIVALSNVAYCGDRSASDSLLKGVAQPH